MKMSTMKVYAGVMTMAVCLGRAPRASASSDSAADQLGIKRNYDKVSVIAVPAFPVGMPVLAATDAESRQEDPRGLGLALTASLDISDNTRESSTSRGFWDDLVLKPHQPGKATEYSERIKLVANVVNTTNAVIGPVTIVVRLACEPDRVDWECSERLRSSDKVSVTLGPGMARLMTLAGTIVHNLGTVGGLENLTKVPIVGTVEVYDDVGKLLARKKAPGEMRIH